MPAQIEDEHFSSDVQLFPYLLGDEEPPFTVQVCDSQSAPTKRGSGLWWDLRVVGAAVGEGLL